MDRLTACAQRMISGTCNHDPDVGWALLEAFLIHDRNMLDFLCSRGRDDTIKATDYIPGFSCDHDPDDVIRQRINRALTHLDRERGGQDPEWQIGPMVVTVTHAWNEFVTECEKG
jgi:hypothetical protein